MSLQCNNKSPTKCFGNYGEHITERPKQTLATTVTNIGLNTTHPTHLQTVTTTATTTAAAATTTIDK